MSDPPPRHRGGRPRAGTPILIRIPADLLAVLDSAAAAAGTTRAQLLRELLTEALAARAQGGPGDIRHSTDNQHVDLGGNP